MIGKEVRSAAWKFGFVALIVLVVLTFAPTPYEEIVENVELQREMNMGEGEIPPPPGDFQMTEREAEEMYDPVDSAMNELSAMYVAGGAAGVVLLGGLLGAGLVSSEVGGGTILALLSRPISRRRLFLTKYAVCAAFLLGAAVLGAVALFFVAFLRGYPFGEITWPGLLLAVFLMWLVSLFPLGMAMLVSTLTRNVMASLVGTAAAVLLVLAFPLIIIFVAEFFLWNELYFEDGTGQIDRLYGVAYSLTLYSYWPDFGYFWPGGDFFATNPAWSASAPKLADFVVCFFAATIPLLSSLWLFNRKKF